MRKRQKRFRDRHHIVPRSRNGSDDETNLIILDRTIHEQLHDLFKNMLPHEQLLFILELNQSSLTNRTVKDLNQILLSDWKYLYKQEVFIG